MYLRDYQSAAVESAKSWIKYKSDPALLVLPTAAGKTIIIKYLIEHCYREGKRILLLAHRKELLQQSGNKLDVPFTYYSASLGAKDRLDDQVTVAAIQSIYSKQVEETGLYDIILVDECHRIPNSREGQYWALINKHPQSKLVGLTATPHRLKGGGLEWGTIIYDIGYAPLIEAGWLCRPTNKVSASPDLSNIPIKLGDYLNDELEEVMADKELMNAAVARIKHYTVARNKVLIFAVSVKHAELLREVLALNELFTEVVTGDTPTEMRDTLIENFKNGDLKYLINVELLLEGFDMPQLDCIVCLRPTQSKVLWQQMMGRGVRTYEGKGDFLLLDLAGNLQEHGGLGSPIKEKAKKETKQRVGRICPVCESFLEGAGIKECPDCGYEFPAPEAPKVSHNREVDTRNNALYGSVDGDTLIVTYAVRGVSYHEHFNTKKRTTSIRVDYDCPMAKYSKISEWLAFKAESDFARNKCFNFYRDRGVRLIADTNEYGIDELLDKARGLRTPESITVDHSERFPRILSYKWRATTEIAKTSAELLDDDNIPWIA